MGVAGDLLHRLDERLCSRVRAYASKCVRYSCRTLTRVHRVASPCHTHGAHRPAPLLHQDAPLPRALVPHAVHCVVREARLDGIRVAKLRLHAPSTLPRCSPPVRHGLGIRTHNFCLKSHMSTNTPFSKYSVKLKAMFQGEVARIAHVDSRCDGKYGISSTSSPCRTLPSSALGACDTDACDPGSPPAAAPTVRDLPHLRRPWPASQPSFSPSPSSLRIAGCTQSLAPKWLRTPLHARYQGVHR
jgi:hypothetical protein